MFEPIGEIIVTSTSEITGQCRREWPIFEYGSLIAAGSPTGCIGIVYNVETTSIDPNRRPVALERSEGELERCFPHLKSLLRNQFQALLIGSMKNERFYYGLPATPPNLHAQVRLCTEEEIREIGEQPGFLRLVHDSGKSSSEELILSCCQHLLNALGWRDEHTIRIGKALSELYRDDYDTLRRLISRLELWLNR